MGVKTELNTNPKPPRKTFDAVLKKLLESEPIPQNKVKASRRRKLGRVLDNKDGNR